MQITVQRKSLGRSRKLEAVVYELVQPPQTLRELLRALVEIESARYNEADSLLHFLTAEQESTVETRGSIAFSPRTQHQTQPLEHSIHVMEQAFCDGLFKVMQGQYVYISLDESVQPGTQHWTFIKLAFLAGR